MLRSPSQGYILVLLAMVCSACSTVPVTGRRSMAFIPQSQLSKISLDSYRALLEESELSTDPNQLAYVGRVGERLAGATHAYLEANGYSTAGYVWEFNVIKEDDTINAFAMPGGKIAVYTGILPITQSDAGLAVVMSHEIAHVLARHGNERMTQGLIAQLGGQALSAALSSQPERTNQLFMTSYGAVANVGVMLPFSRLHESEADHIGMILMAIGGYNPQESIAFWQRMDAQSGGGKRPPQLLSTHPEPGKRAERLNEHMSEAMTVYNRQMQKIQ
ncbi:MAG TPA: M48 family peptidase [Candidatus Hydrogenedentes bacterium]|nr:M48 family peptidase [Candidatus Hydrogenedentota bacterium]